MSMLRIEIPVVTPLGEGTTVYVSNTGIHMNDCWCVILDDGSILHFLSSDLQHVGNGTLGIPRPEPRSATAAAAQRLAGLGGARE